METGYQIQVKATEGFKTADIMVTYFRGKFRTLNIHTWLVYSGVHSDDKELANTIADKLESEGIKGVDVQEIYI